MEGERRKKKLFTGKGPLEEEKVKEDKNMREKEKSLFFLWFLWKKRCPAVEGKRRYPKNPQSKRVTFTTLKKEKAEEKEGGDEITGTRGELSRQPQDKRFFLEEGGGGVCSWGGGEKKENVTSKSLGKGEGKKCSTGGKGKGGPGKNRGIQIKPKNPDEGRKKKNAISREGSP